ncbi:ganglioside GM2 activator-like isoform X2 [Myxocyprinus asiaticus]|uniref:ganglioside GM2 activator-like isoform X2 n=1 Tax=Myxocyprinus asiaticus TaxID=70543 RepID=UPI0022212E3E|nr:ganglioside GM2 activator-like isoform X2 [Myxocyprinus asiaticus]
MKSHISFITLFAAHYVFLEASCNSHSRNGWKLTKVLGFSWANCGKPDDPAYLKTLNLSPDPIPIPGYLTADASGTTSVELTSPLSDKTALSLCKHMACPATVHSKLVIILCLRQVSTYQTLNCLAG